MRQHNLLDSYRETKISIKVVVPELKREFNFKVPAKTRGKEIANKLCLLLDVDPIRSDVYLYPQFGFHEMNPASTLAQTGVKHGSSLIAKIGSTGYGSKVNTYYKIISKKSNFGASRPENYVNEDNYPVYSLKTHSEFLGLKVKGVCTNLDCVAYNKDVVYPFGSGDFDVNTILSNTKCKACPYRDLGLQKPISIKVITLVNCYWKLEGNYLDANGFYNYKYMKKWIKTEGADSSIFYEKIQEYDYLNPKLSVKEL